VNWYGTKSILEHEAECFQEELILDFNNIEFAEEEFEKRLLIEKFTPHRLDM
jgi:hypothetical protein